MVKSKKPVRLWSDPDFAALIKKAAVSKGLTYKEFTKRAVNEPRFFKDLEDEAREQKKKKGVFDSIF